MSANALRLVPEEIQSRASAETNLLYLHPGQPPVPIPEKATPAEARRQYAWDARGRTLFHAATLSQARLLLLRSLTQPGDNLVVLNANSLNWPEKTALQAHDIGLRQHSPTSSGSFPALVDERTRVIYLETIGEELSVPDFQKVIRFAADRGLTVVADNTAGAGGLLFDPIYWGAHYVLSDLQYWHIDSPEKVTVQASSLVETLPEGLQKGKFQSASPDDAVPAPAPARSWNGNRYPVQRLREVLAATQALAGWLAQSPLVSRVLFPGLPSHPDHFNTLKFFRHGYGNRILFTLRGGPRAYYLLQKHLLLSPVPGVTISPRKGNPGFAVEVNSGEAKAAIDGLARPLSLLRQDREFRHLLLREGEELERQIRRAVEKEVRGHLFPG